MVKGSIGTSGYLLLSILAEIIISASTDDHTPETFSTSTDEERYFRSPYNGMKLLSIHNQAQPTQVNTSVIEGEIPFEGIIQQRRKGVPFVT